MGWASLAVLLLTGCGTTRWSDTARTATEQLLISDAIDKSVSEIDVSPFAGQRVYFDTDYLDKGVQHLYLVSTLRQYLLANGCLLQDKRDNADFVLEARAGVVGTDRSDMLIGVPQMQLPAMVPGMPSQIPEIPLVKKTKQKGVAKIAMFGYHRETGSRVWQSDLMLADADARSLWMFGAGPFESDSSRRGTRLAGDRIGLFGEAKPRESRVRQAFGEASWPLAVQEDEAEWKQPAVNKVGHSQPEPGQD